VTGIVPAQRRLGRHLDRPETAPDGRVHHQLMPSVTFNIRAQLKKKIYSAIVD
jgi:hypothetical protein